MLEHGTYNSRHEGDFSSENEHERKLTEEFVFLCSFHGAPRIYATFSATDRVLFLQRGATGKVGNAIESRNTKKNKEQRKNKEGSPPKGAREKPPRHRSGGFLCLNFVWTDPLVFLVFAVWFVFQEFYSECLPSNLLRRLSYVVLPSDVY